MFCRHLPEPFQLQLLQDCLILLLLLLLLLKVTEELEEAPIEEENDKEPNPNERRILSDHGL